MHRTSYVPLESLPKPRRLVGKRIKVYRGRRCLCAGVVDMVIKKTNHLSIDVGDHPQGRYVGVYLGDPERRIMVEAQKK